MDYIKEYARLNKQQKLAVDTIDGPVLVIAGPGTGKTQLLGMRVANILDKTDAAAHEILCLTFTEKAATNMRERLGQFIGTEAHNVVIKTFHGFGAEIMNMYPDYFWNAAKLSAAPDAVQLEVIESILAKLPHYNPLALRFAGNPTLTKDVKNALKYAKEAGLSPEKLKAVVELNLAYIDEIEPLLGDVLTERISKKSIAAIQDAMTALPDQSIDIAPLQPLSEIIKSSFGHAVTQIGLQGKTTPVSDWKKQWFQTKAGISGMHEERKRNLWWQALADVYTKYRNNLHKRGYFDYADMIIEVITQLEKNEDLRAQVQERFNYVLIDEFQDTNEAQMRLAHLVADHFVAEGNPNIMTVGDDDQAIYKFQGAELNNLLNFRRSYPKAQVVVLEENYRSHQDILDTARQVIEQAENRLVTHEADISKNIRAVSERQKGKIQHFSYATQADQYVDIAKRIETDFRPARNVAVIARNNESLRQMASILHANSVPVHYEQQNNVFDHPMSRQLLRICAIIQALLDGDSQSADVHLAQSLRHPMWHIEPETLWHLAIAGRTSDWLTSLRVQNDCAWIVTWLEQLASCATTERLDVLISRILGLETDSSETASPIHHFYIHNQELSSEYLGGLSAIRLVRSLVADFSRGNQPSLGDFLRFVEVHEQNNLILADESPFITAPHAVQLLTIYKAKGLEFDSVYILDAVESNWSPRKGGRKPPANLPLRPAGDDWDDYVRLMYVGITRAISDVTVSSFRTDVKGKEILATPIISHVLQSQEIPASESLEAVKVLETNLSWPRLDSKNEKQLLGDVLSRYQINATAIIHFLDLERNGPETFLENQLLRTPRAKTPFQSHGTAMHAALEYGQKLTNIGKFDVNKVVETYQQNLSLEMLPRDEYTNWLEEGERAVRYLFNELGFAFKPGDKPERKFKSLIIGDCLVSGAFDNISEDGKRLEITDYKTGAPVSKLTATTKTEGVKAWRHRTQLIFYALMAKHVPDYADKQTKGTMMYVEADEPRFLSRSYEPSQDEIERMLKLTNRIWSKIQNLDFPDTNAYEPSLAGIEQFENDLLADKI